jgi:hypothetical protein
MLSPTCYVAQRVGLEAKLDIAREEGDLVRMQRALAKLTALHRTMCGIEAMAKCSFR